MAFKPTHTLIDSSKYEKPFEVQRVRILEAMLPSCNGDNAIDIGSGPGYFSKMLSEKGWRTTAIDTDSNNIEMAKNYSAESHLGDAITILSKLPDDHYGLVIALEIIEHLPKSVGEDLLSKIARVLRPNGRLIISTPNRHSPEGLGCYYLGERLIGWKKWYAWDNTHVHIYSSTEILHLLKRRGFTIDKITGYCYGCTLPLITHWKYFLVKSTLFPFNLFGFNTIIECHKTQTSTPP